MNSPVPVAPVISSPVISSPVLSLPNSPRGNWSELREETIRKSGKSEEQLARGIDL